MLETENLYTKRFTDLHDKFIKDVKNINEGEETTKDMNIGEIDILEKKFMNNRLNKLILKSSQYPH